MARYHIKFAHLDKPYPSENHPTISNWKQHGSYHFDEKKRTIIAPGIPNYVENEFPKNGTQMQLNFMPYPDENEYHAMHYQFSIDTFTRILEMNNSSNDLSSIDFLTDRSTLKQLFGFCSGKPDLMDLNEHTDILIDIQQIDQTIIMTRHRSHHGSKHNRETYGKDFETTITRPGLNIDCSWRLLASCNFGTSTSSYKLLVRSTPDAVAAVSYQTTSITRQQCKKPIQGINFTHFGEICKQWQPVELVTRSVNEPTVPAYKWPQMYFSCGQELVVGWHWEGDIRRIERLNIQEVEKHFEREHPETAANALRRLKTLLDKLKKFMGSVKGKYQLHIGEPYNVINIEPVCVNT